MADKHTEVIEYDREGLTNLATRIAALEDDIHIIKSKISAEESMLAERKILLEQLVIQQRQAQEKMDEIVKGVRRVIKINSKESLDDNK